MMKRDISYILLGLLILPLFSGCKPEARQLDPEPCPGAVVQLNLDVPDRPEVHSLRAPEPSRESEEAIDDLYLLVFDQSGNRVDFVNGQQVSRYFSNHDLGLSRPYTTGILSNIMLPSGTNTIYLLANVEASYNMTIKKEHIDKIKTEAQLKNLEVSFDNIYQAPSNRGVRNNILMWGRATVQVTCGMKKDIKVNLRSVESKVRFRFFVHPDVQDYVTVELDAYSVQNIPRRGLVVADRFLEFSYANREQDVYNIGITPFDVPEEWDDNNSPSPADANGAKAKFIGDFYFYQMENSQEPKKQITQPAPEGLKLRTKLLKNADGTNHRELKTDLPSFEYAPDMCTFVRVKATVTCSKPGGEYVADTYYYFPLGHDPKDPNSYSVLGNYTYTYNVFIKGVKDIMIEADVKSLNKDLYDNDGSLSGKEVNPLTEGAVFFDAKEVKVDAHYANFALNIPKTAIELIRNENREILYFARTPFDERHMDTEGKKDINWVTFSPMKGNDSKLIPYPGDQASAADAVPLIRVNELTDWIKNTDLTNYLNSDGSITLTTYVDEYFYDQNPITGGPVTYSDFVNKADRGMSISIKFATSKDERSALYRQNILRLRQQAIWSIFGGNQSDITPDGYGMESIDETYPMTTPTNRFRNIRYTDVNHINGRLNMLNVWDKSDMARGDYRIRFTDGNKPLWRFKLVPTRSNMENVMHWKNGDPSYAHEGYVKGNWWNDFQRDKMYDNAAFACLQRNRDNNGNGYIDEDEIRWYLPSFAQVINTYIGKATIPDKYWFHSLRYRIESNQPARFRDMMYAVSTPTGGSHRTIGSYWADEGISFGDDVAYRVRCFRNLPAQIVADAPNVEPIGDFGYIGTWVKATATSPAYVKVSSRMSPTSYRARFVESGPLPMPHYYRDAVNSLRYEFYVAKENIGTQGSFEDVYNKYYALGKDPCDSYEEKGVRGWRTPNQTELSVMFMIDMGMSGVASDGTPTLNALGALDKTFSCTYAVPNISKQRINLILDGNRIIERDWNQRIGFPKPEFVRCVKDKK